MSGFLDKMSNFFFKDEEVEEKIVEEYREELERPAVTPPPVAERNIWKEQEARRPAATSSGKKTNLMSIPTKVPGKEGSSMEMVLIKASSYDDMQEIARHIKERKVAVVNFEEMDKDVAQRMVDFLSGAVYALDGVPRKVSGGTFIFSSANVDLSGQIMDKDHNFEDILNDDRRFSSNQWLRK